MQTKNKPNKKCKPWNISGTAYIQRLFYEVVEIKMKIALVLLVQIVQPNWGAAVREGEAGEGAAVSIMKRETSTKGEERHLEFGREKKEFLRKANFKIKFPTRHKNA